MARTDQRDVGRFNDRPHSTLRQETVERHPLRKPELCSHRLDSTAERVFTDDVQMKDVARVRKFT